jgi:hypothetical protein|tara:strand:- start:1515 stop:2486 length:972 start_codon:yes stop_codon:yes gene_type:complete
MKKNMIIIVLVITIIACGAESTESAKKHSDNSVKDSVLKIESGFVIKKTKDTVIIVEENKADKLELTIPESIALNEKIVIKKIEAFKKASPENIEFETNIAPKHMVINFNHLKFNEILQKNVSSTGVVNYDSLKKEEYKLNEYLKMLAVSDPKTGWSRNKKLAYYINLYNASTISLILQNYPLKSIKDIDKPWDISFIKVGAKTLSLNDIEHKIIRPTFKEPRVHFSVNCAATSCPKLSNKAFSEKNINALLQENTERFMADSFSGLRSDGKEIELSQIFEWYIVDFGGKDSLLQWITNNSIQDLSQSKLKGFISYSWELNNK